MKPPKFTYWDPATVDEVVDLLAQHADGAKLLAGGQSLMPVVSMRLARPEHLIDLNGVAELHHLRPERDRLRLGAMTRHDTLGSSPDVRRLCPLIAKAVPYIGHAAIRYRGTLGGSVAHADPSAELPALAVALDADVTLKGPNGVRTIPARDFFVSYFTTLAEPDEVLTDVTFPAQPPGAGSAVAELARRHGDFALAGVAVSVSADGGDRVESARICAFGVDEAPRRIDGAEAVLAGGAPTREALEEAGRLAAEAVDPESDMHATADYRREMTAVLTRRALEEALAEAGVGLN